jgi:hypothetical protein
MWFGDKSKVESSDIMLFYVINMSRKIFLYGIAIGKDNYRATNHPKWKWSKGILPVRVARDLEDSLIHDLDNPITSEVFQYTTAM